MGVHSEVQGGRRSKKYKACLVAQGFRQTYGIYYEETFAPVAKLNFIPVLLSLVANLDWSYTGCEECFSERKS